MDGPGTSPKAPYDNCVAFMQQQMCDAAIRTRFKKEIAEADTYMKEGRRDEFVEAVTLLMYVARPRELNANRLH